MRVATPCCHTQLTPAMWPFGSAVRVLDTALRSRRSAALLVCKHTPPSLHLHLHLNQRRNNITRGDRIRVRDWTRGTPRRPQPALSAQEAGVSERSVPEVRPARSLARQQLRAVPRRAGPFASP